MRPAISVLVLSYNSKRYLDDCFRSIFASRGAPPFEVVLVDNGGSDGAADWAEKAWPAVRTSCSPRNLGVAGGKRLLSWLARGDILFFLDNDSTLHPDALCEIANYLRDHPEVGVVGPRTVYPGGAVAQGVFSFPTISTHLQKVLALGRRLGDRRWFGFHRVGVYRYERVLDADWAPGNALVIRRRALRDAGGWDPEFFCYFDETDLCWRVKRAGWRVHLLPFAEVTHHVGSVSGKSIRFSRAWANVSSVLFFRKAYGFPRSAAFTLLRLFTEAAVDARCLIEWLSPSRRDHARAVLRSSGDFYRFLLDRLHPYRALGEV